MTQPILYAMAGVALFSIGLGGVFTCGHVLRKILAANITGSGVFLLLVAIARRAPTAISDPVPHALVLTGIVVSVSATALALAIARQLSAVGTEPSIDTAHAPATPAP